MAVMYEWNYGLDETLGLFEFNTPGEDIWKKFEDLPDFGSELGDVCELESALFGDSNPMWCGSNEIRNHDCMWAGTCVSEDHRRTLEVSNKVRGPADATSPPTVEPAPPAPATPKPAAPQLTPAPAEPSLKKPKSEPKSQTKRTGVIIQKTVGRSLLLSSRPNAAKTSRTAEVTRPETPQSLSESEEEDIKPLRDDEPTAFRGVSASEVTGQVRRTIVVATSTDNVQFDHNYDSKSKNVRTDDLGIQTPSDSEEEEIDVVSLVSSRSQTTLPTNPSRAMRQELQQTVKHAITNNKLLSASRAVSRRLKATGPGRKPKRKRVSSDDEEEFVPFEPRSAKANKRARFQHHHHYHQRRSPKKSRTSTDSETDTSERRSMHNNMERMRRIDLRNAFDDLRTLLPSLVNKTRAPKVTILKDATLYLHELSAKDRSMQSHVAALRKEQEKLRANLSQLRRSLAAKR